MKNVFVTILTVLALVSCQTDESTEQEYPYYQFGETEQKFIINHEYKEGDILVYKNEDNESLHFEVVEVTERKARQFSEGTFSGGGGHMQAYFDSKIIRLEIIENGTNYSCCDQINYVFSKREDVFRVGLKFPLWNQSSASFIDEIQNPIDITIDYKYGYTYQNLTLNGVNYDSVLKFESETPNRLYNDSTNIDILVNEIFYDLGFGIVQFKDTDGKLWSLTNE